jgi:uncharacterized protein (DUF58 family)
VRPFQDGDSLKQVHWKSSAKGLGLMVKTFEEELSGRVSFILDNGQPGQAQTLDDCARAAGSLMFAAHEAGEHVEMIDLSRLEPVVVPPFADGREIFEALARLPFTDDKPPAGKPGTALKHLSQRSAVCFVLTEFNSAIGPAIDHLLNQRRHVSIYLPAGSRRPGELPGVPVFAYSGKEIIDWP